MSAIKMGLVSLTISFALLLPGCDYVVDGLQNGVEDYVTATTFLVLEAILPIEEIFQLEE